jgi:hypothetical protein
MVSERNDLSLKRKDKRDELLDDVLTRMKKTGAKMPQQPNAEYDSTEVRSY